MTPDDLASGRWPEVSRPLTDESIAAIRARHTDSIGPFWDENGYVIGQWCNEDDAAWPCDAITLLAEVDRLRPIVEAAFASGGAAAERARIRAGADGLTRNLDITGAEDEAFVLLAEVLRIIDGGESDRQREPSVTPPGTTSGSQRGYWVKGLDLPAGQTFLTVMDVIWREWLEARKDYLDQYGVASEYDPDRDGGSE